MIMKIYKTDDNEHFNSHKNIPRKVEKYPILVNHIIMIELHTS
jgi:hypothetical protein